MTNFLVGPPAASGAVLAIATVPLHLILSKPHSKQFAAVIGAIYVGLGLQKGNRPQIATEISAAAGFIAAALAALWVSAWIAPVAYAVHGIWDYAHHEDARIAPRPWKLVAIPVSFCAVYDWLAAAFWSSFGACELK